MSENKVTKTKKEPKKEKCIEDVYKKKSQHQHILDLPDTYIGGIVMDEVRLFVFNSETEKIEENVINYVGGLYKIFDEILVNARDHTVRDPTCKHISIDIDKITGEISVWNDGTGIPVAIHKEHKLYIVELLFGTLLTSTNYDELGKKTGGRNGIGGKATSIFSKRFEVHTIGFDKLTPEGAKKVEYKQEWTNNMFDVGEPMINKKIQQTAKMFTKVTFLPDYERFGMNGLTDDMYDLMMRRCYDIAACSPKTVKITLNGKEVKNRDFKDYIKMYYGDDKKDKPKITYEKVNSRWEVGIGYNLNVGDRYISFVNGISTFQGGAHVSHVVNNVVAKVIGYINKKKEFKDLKIMPVTVKRYLTFFINCVVEDPAFNSQTKEFMNSKPADWCRCGNDCPDVKCDISDEFIEKLCAGDLMTEVVKASQFQSSRELTKTDGRKVGKLNIDKLEDAKWAGGRNSHKTSIFLTEGDSAKAFAVSGISVIGNEQYGVFPLKGKVLNVRNAGPAQIKKNKEFFNIKQILGLKQGVKYKNVSKLRYGSVIIMTDQDPDGSHIKGLIINMLEFFWPELLKIEGFIKAYNTPIVKTWKKTDKKRANELAFYSVIEYENWKNTQKNGDLWAHKYYKGLGTSSGKEAKESFYKFEDNIVTFEWEDDPMNADDQSEDYEEDIDKQITKLKTNLKKKTEEKPESKKKKKDDEEEDQNSTESIDEEEEDKATRAHVKCRSHQCIEKVFNKYRVGERKLWLQKLKKSDSLKYSAGMRLTYSDFFDRDMIFFSNDDNDRSIPSMTDGLKPSQRMIMYCCFKRGRRAKEVKVAQLAGYVARCDHWSGTKLPRIK
jgi:DNA topoisomerase II